MPTLPPQPSSPALRLPQVVSGVRSAPKTALSPAVSCLASRVGCSGAAALRTLLRIVYSDRLSPQRRSELADLVHHGGEDLEQITDNGVVGKLHDGCMAVTVDGNDEVG